MQRVEELIRTDSRIRIDIVATAHGLAYSIMHDRLKFRKVCAWWVPRELKDRQKMTRKACPWNILRNADEGEDMLNRIVTGDE
jgi:hypothetical protein